MENAEVEDVVELQSRALLSKVRTRIANMKHADAKTVVLNEILPLIDAMIGDMEELSAATNDNFEDVYSELGIDEEDGNFIPDSIRLVAAFSTLLDDLLVLAGVAARTDAGLLQFTDKIDDELRSRLAALQVESSAWMTRATTLAELVGASDDEEDDEREGGEGDFEEVDDDNAT